MRNTGYSLQILRMPGKYSDTKNTKDTISYKNDLNKPMLVPRIPFKWKIPISITWGILIIRVLVAVAHRFDTGFHSIVG